jgi:septal ring factor EnvC (AmiA/AmiB activator)
MSENSGKFEARELGIILGKLDGIHDTQSRMQRQLETQSTEIAAIRTDIAVIKTEQAERNKALDELEERVDSQSTDLAKVKGSWKMAIVRYTATGGAGAGLLAALLKAFGFKFGGE